MSRKTKGNRMNSIGAWFMASSAFLLSAASFYICYNLYQEKSSRVMSILLAVCGALALCLAGGVLIDRAYPADIGWDPPYDECFKGCYEFEELTFIDWDDNKECECKWEPKEDITAYELSQIIPALYASINYVYPTLTDGAKRHLNCNEYCD